MSRPALTFTPDACGDTAMLGKVGIGRINRHEGSRWGASWISYLPISACGTRMLTPKRLRTVEEARKALAGMVEIWLREAGFPEAPSP